MPKRILVTRPEAQSGPLTSAIETQGDVAVALPLLAIIPFTETDAPQACASIRQRIQHLADYQHVIFISTNAVDAGFDWIDRFWPQLPAGQIWYAIGQATAERLRHHTVEAEQAGPAMNSESLLQHPNLQALQQQKVLIVRGDGGRDYLREQLQARGATVDYCDVYQRMPCSYPPGTLKKLLNQGLDFLTVTSTETIQQLLDQAIIDGVQNHITATTLIVPGLRVAAFARQKGFRHICVADNAGVAAMLEALHKNTKGE